VRPVGQLVQSVFKLIDKTRFEIFAFMLEAHDNSQVLVNIANSVDEWHWVKGLSPLTIAQMVNNEQPHVLVDLNGFTDGCRLEVGALKPAPVSVNYLGFPYTLTVPGFDYILSDRVVLPPEQHPECFMESAGVVNVLLMCC
jgi:predicted O-linked N-acetylglucosamine transferase (SPINDLY family)